MGRSKYNYLPRAYVTYPLVCPNNIGAGGDPETELVHLPVDMTDTHIGEATDPESRRGANRLASPVLGAMISLGDNSIYAAQLDVDVEDASVTCLTNAHSFAASDVGSATAKLGYVGESGTNWLATKIGGTTGQSVKMICTAGAGDTFIDPALSMVLSPGRVVDGSSNVLAPSGGVTNTRGPVAGALVTVTLQEVDLADEQEDIALREITMPFGMRVQKVITSTASANTGNTIYVRNDTQSQDIVLNSNVMNTATPTSETHEPGGNLVTAGRDIARGDVIQLRGSTDTGTDTGGFTRGCAILVGHVTDHITADGTRLIPYDGTNWPSSHEKVTSEMSGPVAGGLATLYLAGNDVTTSQTDLLIAACKVPFDCTLLHAQFQYKTSAVGNSATIMDGATEIVPDTSLIASGGAALVVTSFTNTALTRGDTLTLLATTAGTGMTNLGCTLLVHVTGFPHDNPLND